MKETPKKSTLTKKVSAKEKKKRADKTVSILLYVGIGIAACVLIAIVGLVIWFVFFRLGGIMGLIISILCFLAFIPELFRKV